MRLSRLRTQRPPGGGGERIPLPSHPRPSQGHPHHRRRHRSNGVRNRTKNIPRYRSGRSRSPSRGLVLRAIGTRPRLSASRRRKRRALARHESGTLCLRPLQNALLRPHRPSAVPVRSPAFCGAPFTCMKASISNNGKFLVVSEVPSESGVEEPGQIAMRIYPRENFINAKDGLSAPATYWTNRLSWSVILDLRSQRSEPACPVPLITGDGEFLVLLQIGPMATLGGTAVQVYRRRDHIGDLMGIGPDHGVFIRSISLKELWLPGGPDVIPRSATERKPSMVRGRKLRLLVR